jgi:hypothetical protein
MNEKVQRAGAMFERFDREVTDKINNAAGVIVYDGLGRLWTIKRTGTPFGEIRILEISWGIAGSTGIQYQVSSVRSENGQEQVAAYVRDWDRKKYRPQDAWFHDNDATAFNMMEVKLNQLLPATVSRQVELTPDISQQV